MKRITTTIAVLLLLALSGCSYKLYNFTPTPPTISRLVDEPYEDVWDGVIDIVSTAGLPIQLLDKPSGLIVIGETEFPTMFWLDNNKDIAEKSAYLLAQYGDSYQSGINDIRGFASWNIRVRPSAVNTRKTEVTINIVNPRAMVRKETGYILILFFPFPTYEYVPYIGRMVSSGRFENIFIDAILDKKKINDIKDISSELQTQRQAQQEAKQRSQFQ